MHPLWSCGDFGYGQGVLCFFLFLSSAAFIIVGAFSTRPTAHLALTGVGTSSASGFASRYKGLGFLQKKRECGYAGGYLLAGNRRLYAALRSFFNINVFS
jgi:hypothetical protein